MMRPKQVARPLVNAAILLALGCGPTAYTTPVSVPIEKERTIDKPFDAVWQQAVEWFATHNTPIKNIDKASGLISTEYSLSLDEATKYADCGTGSSDFNGKVEIEKPVGNFNLIVTRKDEQAVTVKVNVFFTCITNRYRYENVLSTNYVLESSSPTKCTSRGALEREILGYLAQAQVPPTSVVSEAPEPTVEPKKQDAGSSPPARCTSDNECRAGRVCVQGACAYATCARDVDCPEPMICEKGSCVSAPADTPIQ